jgi:hypothetical protein
VAKNNLLEKGSSEAEWTKIYNRWKNNLLKKMWQKLYFEFSLIFDVDVFDL